VNHKYPSEEQEQSLIVQWFRIVYARQHHLDPRLLFHVPNGGQRSKSEAGRFRSAGVTRGVPDLFLAVPRRGHAGLWIELKSLSRSARLSGDQAEMIELLRASGYAAEVAYGHEDAQSVIESYLYEEQK
jgi:hypothetical protein